MPRFLDLNKAGVKPKVGTNVVGSALNPAVGDAQVFPNVAAYQQAIPSLYLPEPAKAPAKGKADQPAGQPVAQPGAQDSFLDIALGPSGRYILAQLGQALAGGRQQSFAYQLGDVASKLAQTSAMQAYMKQPEGTAPAPSIAAAMSPSMLAEAQRQRYVAAQKQHMKTQEAQAQEQIALQQKTLKEVTKPATEQQIKESKARTSTYMSAETEKNLREKEIAMHQNIAEMTANPWMKLAPGVVFNWKDERIHDYSNLVPGTGETDTAKSADYKLFRTFTADVMLPKMWETYKASLSKEFKDLQEFVDAVSASEGGAIQPGKVLAHLPPEGRIQFGQFMARYEQARAQGKPLTQEFLNQIAEMNVEKVPDLTGRDFSSQATLPADLKPGDQWGGRVYKGGDVHNKANWLPKDTWFKIRRRNLNK